VNKDRTLVESFIRTATDMPQMSDLALIDRYGEVSRVLRHVPDLTSDQVAERVVSLHRKHAGDVTRVIRDAIAANAKEILNGSLPASCAIILSLPANYKTVKQTKVSAVGNANVGPPRGWDRAESPYSENDKRVYELIGEHKFRSWNNDSIRRHFMAQIRRLRGKQLSPNALRACLNRIRRHWNFPMSEEILKNSVNE
jgi:hypothetical protein